MIDQGAARVLYIEDDEGLARLVTKTLSLHGFKVDHALNGQQAIDRINLGGIDVVALDHFLAVETGLDILPAIQATELAPPVIYVTGSDDSRIAVAALKAGAVDYVWKDVHGQFRELLAKSIINALRNRQLELEKVRADREILEARDRAELLLHEVNHRVANSLALVSALARMQMAAVQDAGAKAALGEMQARVSAIAQVHRRLYTSKDVRSVELNAYLSSLISELDSAVTSHRGGGAIKLDVDQIAVPTDAAVSIGIAVTELVTNAVKYAYPEGSTQGDVRVFVKKAEEGQAVLTVEDDGIGYAGGSAPTGTGLGTRIIKAMSQSLRSTLEYDQNYRGTRVTLNFPVPEHGNV